MTKSRFNSIEVPKICPSAITTNFIYENAPQYLCETLQEKRCLHFCSCFVCPTTIWSSSFNPMCSKCLYPLRKHSNTHSQNFSSAGLTNIFFVTVGSLDHFIARISRLIAICDAFFHRRLNMIKNEKAIKGPRRP